jgi:hypothetical protein
VSAAETVSEQIGNAILVLRGHRVMLDADLARLDGVPTKVLHKSLSINTVARSRQRIALRNSTLQRLVEFVSWRNDSSCELCATKVHRLFVNLLFYIQ